MEDNLDKVEVALLEKGATEHKSTKNAIPQARILLSHFHSISAGSEGFVANKNICK